MMLAGPPAEAIMYVNEFIGLSVSSSEYGGGGSPSSIDFPDALPFASLLSLCALSASSSARASSKEGAGAAARYDSVGASDTAALKRSSSALVGKYNEENGGGRGEGGLEQEASERSGA
jgi:hypothetical protein